jgi:hypothetical protein
MPTTFLYPMEHDKCLAPYEARVNGEKRDFTYETRYPTPRSRNTVRGTSRGSEDPWQWQSS